MQPSATGILTSFDKHGNSHTYDYTCEKCYHRDLTMWCYQIFVAFTLSTYDFQVVEDGDRMRVENMYRDGDDLKGKGLAEAFIRLVHSEFHLPVCSSKTLLSKDQTSGSELHSQDARAVWSRLAEKGFARLDEGEGRFIAF